MAVKKVLVLSDSGSPEELQNGDSIQTGAALPSANNANAGIATKGMVVYPSSDTNVDLAQANAQGTTKALGLCNTDSVNNGASMDIITEGAITCTLAQWDAIAGTSGGLDEGETYFLSPDNAGQLIASSAVSGISTGQFVAALGYAMNTVTMIVRINPTPIKRG